MKGQEESEMKAIYIKNPVNQIRNVIRKGEERRYHISSIVLICVVFFLPFLRGDERLTWVAFQFVFCLLLLTGIVLMNRNRITLLIACILAIPAFEIGWVAVAAINPALYEYALILGICFLSVLIAVILSKIITVQKRETWILSAAISLYLLLIIIWGMVYLLLFLSFPDFFASTAGQEAGTIYIGDLFTFSSSTLVPVGYPSLVHITSSLSYIPVIESLTGTLCIMTIFLRTILIPVNGATSAETEKQ